jgi:hypothetical protein
MAGRQLRSKKASDSVWSEKDNSSQDVFESNKILEQGESAGKVVAEKIGDAIQDLGYNELETVSGDDVEITLGQVATSGENM